MTEKKTKRYENIMKDCQDLCNKDNRFEIESHSKLVPQCLETPCVFVFVDMSFDARKS